MNGTDVFNEILAHLKDEPVVHANGFIGRESFNVKDRKASFYMIGSMGLASSIGLGVALSQPDKKVIVMDGDGNVLMAMGTLAMIAAAAPKNLVHVVIDNEVYESTGKQRSLSSEVALEEVARATGYPRVAKVSTRDELNDAFKKFMNSEGPSFLLVKAKPEFDHGTGRVTHTPEEITDRFMEAVNR